MTRHSLQQRVERRWAFAAVALAMSAAAAVALYIARPPAPTLEDAILQTAPPDADLEVHLTNYGSDLFSPQDPGRSSSWGDGASGFTASGKDQAPPNGLAG